MTPLDAARAQLHWGRSLLPVGPDKKPHARALLASGHQRHGRPSWQALQHARPAETELRAWFSTPGAQLALVTGMVSGLVVLDADGETGLALFQQYGLTEKAHVRTPSGGLHLYLPHPGWRVRTLQSQTNPHLASVRGMDIRADGGYVLAPPSRTPKGPYRYLRDPRDLEAISSLPRELRALLGLEEAPRPGRPPPAAEPQAQRASSPLAVPLPRQGAEPLSRELLTRALTRAHAGLGRNETGFWLACQLRDNAFDPASARDVMLRYAEQVPDLNSKGQPESYTPAEALHSLTEAHKRLPRDPWTRRAPTPLERLHASWSALGDAQRAQAARCVAGAKGDTREAGLRLLVLLGHDVQATLREVQDAQRAGRALPGLSALVKLLDQAAPEHQGSDGG